MGRINTQSLDEDDIPKLVTTLRNMKDCLSEVKKRTSGVLEQVKNGSYDTLEGLSYLESKHMLLLNYCSNLVYLIMRKAEGKSIQDHPVIERLVEARAYLEKIRPIDKQLQYQIERLIKLAAQVAEKKKSKPDSNSDDESDAGSDDGNTSSDDSSSNDDASDDSSDENVFGQKNEKKIKKSKKSEKTRKDVSKKARSDDERSENEDKDENEDEDGAMSSDDEDNDEEEEQFGSNLMAARKAAAAAGGRTLDQDALRFAPRPHALVQRVPVAAASGSKSESKSKASDVYRPPKLTAASMEMDRHAKSSTAGRGWEEDVSREVADDESFTDGLSWESAEGIGGDKESQRGERDRRRLLKAQKQRVGRSDTMRALAAELADAPEEERLSHPGSGSTAASQMMRQRLQARSVIEEDMFSRVPLNKGELKELKGQRRREMSSSFFADDLGADVADIVAASGGRGRGDADVDSMFGERTAGKKRKTRGGGGGGRGRGGKGRGGKGRGGKR